MRYTPENITKLAENEIFVFGSNARGMHGKGAAKQAYLYFGAEYWVGEGLTGQCYALPTLDGNLNKLSDDELSEHVSTFLDTADGNPNLVFLLTRVGCGLAGYDEEYIKSVFKEFESEWPSNVIKPEGW